MNIFKILIILFLTTFLSSKAFAAKGEATVYKVTITKIEMCDSTSTASSCNGAATVFSGDSGPIDIASTTAGEATIDAPTASNDFVRILGYSLNVSNKKMFLNPDSTWVEIA